MLISHELANKNHISWTRVCYFGSDWPYINYGLTGKFGNQQSVVQCLSAALSKWQRHHDFRFESETWKTILNHLF